MPNEVLKTATQLRDESLRIDRRRIRAQALASTILQAIGPLLRDEDGREQRDAYYKIFDLLHQEGVEVLTDFDRQNLGLLPRDEMGWTDAELRALDSLYMAALLKPITMSAPSPTP